MYVQRNTEEHSYNQRCCGKATSITRSECVFVALGIEHAKLMRRIILSHAACSALQYFHTLSHEGQDFRRNNYRSQNMRFDFLYSFCLKQFSR
jgi:hypothetical protein